MEETVKIYHFTSDGDYSPILVLTEDECLLNGDSTHNMDHNKYVNGLVEGLRLAGKVVVVESIYVDVPEDLEPYVELLTKHDLVNVFDDYFC